MADDGAASIAAGGLVSRRETRVIMAKEVLSISTQKIVVDYDFRNDTNENVTTEVAFPVPPYTNQSEELHAASQAFQSFMLWINENPVQFSAETKATLKNRDVTDLLTRHHINIATFGHQQFEAVGEKAQYPEFSRLPASAKSSLIKAGLFDQQGFGLWTVRLNYHWQQTFPAHGTVHIRHIYKPVEGYSAIYPWELQTDQPKATKSDTAGEHIPVEERLASFCVDAPLLNVLRASMKREQESVDPADINGTILNRSWIDFILTTANTWQRPIEDFTLIIERPKAERGERSLVSFCSPGQVEKLDTDHFQLHLTNFIPKAELHIGFFGVPARPAQRTVKAASKK